MVQATFSCSFEFVKKQGLQTKNIPTLIKVFEEVHLQYMEMIDSIQAAIEMYRRYHGYYDNVFYLMLRR